MTGTAASPLPHGHHPPTSQAFHGTPVKRGACVHKCRATGETHCGASSGTTLGTGQLGSRLHSSTNPSANHKRVSELRFWPQTSSLAHTPHSPPKPRRVWGSTCNHTEKYLYREAEEPSRENKPLKATRFNSDEFPHCHNEMILEQAVSNRQATRKHLISRALWTLKSQRRDVG